MHFFIFSLFPNIFETYFSTSIAARAVKRGLIQYTNINFRDFAYDKHKTCDDVPYGGGPGMIIKPDPIIRAIRACKKEKLYVVYPGPGGRLLTQNMAKKLVQESEIGLIAGRYEGIDQRVIDQWVDEEISLGDYVISSGELGCLVIIDTLLRLVKNVISADSLKEESFEKDLLEYPQYTRPRIFEDLSVPDVLLSGNHKKIKQWRDVKRLEKTLANRPEIIHNIGG